MSKQGQDVIYQSVTDRIVQALEEGTVPWRQTWAGGGVPLRMSNGKAYRGVNVFLLALSGYGSPWWGTYEQIKKLGGQVRKGEKSTTVVFWTKKKITERDPDTGEEQEKNIFLLRFYRVFNAEQADDLPEKFFPVHHAQDEFDVHLAAQDVLDGYLSRESGLSLEHRGNQPQYRPDADSILLPRPKAFESPADYYDTAFHEAGHSTGHSSRLNRDEITSGYTHFGSNKYGREELVAEMTAAMINASVGIDSAKINTNNAAYVAGWLSKIKGDSHLVIQAAGRAQRAADRILGTTFSTDEKSE